MPAIRRRQRTSASGKTLTELRGELRTFIVSDFRRFTGRPHARMGWTPTSYACAVVSRGRGELGWDSNIPFGDPSAIVGGVAVLEYLVELCQCGVIRFFEATAERIELAKRDPLAVLPGVPVKPRKFQQWGKFPRNDLGLARARPVTNPLGLPLRTSWLVGAITPRLILDGFEEGDEVLSDIETDWSSAEEPPESDPIEEWSEEEASGGAGDAAEGEDNISDFEI